MFAFSFHGIFWNSTTTHFAFHPQSYGLRLKSKGFFPRVSPFQIPLSFSLAEQQGFVCIFFPMGRKLWCCPRRAGDKQHPTGVLYLNVQIPLPLPSKKFHPSWGGTFLAEQQGFEPWRQLPSLRDFESRLFDHLSTAPYAPRYYISRKRKNQGFSGGFFAISRTNDILSITPL